MRGRNFIDLTGQRFGRLTVVSRGPNYWSPDGMTMITTWNCKCDCGAEINVMRHNLRSGATRSCGCYKRDRLVALWKEAKACQSLS